MAAAKSCKRTVVTNSWRDLLNWINGEVNGNYTKVEDLSSGCAYCECVKKWLSKSIGPIKIKTPAVSLEDKRHNLKLLNNLLYQLDAKKPVPVDKILKSQFKDNFYYLQWFQNFIKTREALLDDFSQKRYEYKHSKLQDIPIEKEEDAKQDNIARITPRVGTACAAASSRAALLASIHERSQLDELFTMNFLAETHGPIESIEDSENKYTFHTWTAIYHITVTKKWNETRNLLKICTQAVIQNK